MRALSIHVEWLWAILHLGKAIENRSWPPPAKFVGDLIALHGTQRTPDAAGLEAMIAAARAAGWEVLPHPVYDAGWVFQRGGGERPEILEFGDLAGLRGRVAALVRLAGCTVGQQGPWREPGAFHWELADLRPIPGPILCKGAQRLWRLPRGLKPQLVRL